MLYGGSTVSKIIQTASSFSYLARKTESADPTYLRGIIVSKDSIQWWLALLIRYSQATAIVVL